MPTERLEDPMVLAKAARFFEVDPRALRRMVRSGKIRSTKVGKYVLVEGADVKKMADDLRLLRQVEADPRGQKENKRRPAGPRAGKRGT